MTFVRIDVCMGEFLRRFSRLPNKVYVTNHDFNCLIDITYSRHVNFQMCCDFDRLTYHSIYGSIDIEEGEKSLVWEW